MLATSKEKLFKSESIFKCLKLFLSVYYIIIVIAEN